LPLLDSGEHSAFCTSTTKTSTNSAQIRDWHHADSPAVTMYLGDNSSERIYYARIFWLPIGVAATVSLLVSTGVCWRYQKKLRTRFIELTRTLEEGYEFRPGSNFQQTVPTGGVVQVTHFWNSGTSGHQSVQGTLLGRRQSI
jgi:hypothetical protein